MFSSTFAFAALKNDGSVFVWGRKSRGGDPDEVKGLHGVKSIIGNGGAFAALKADGSVFVWGGGYDGGNPDEVKDLTNISYYQE